MAGRHRPAIPYVLRTGHTTTTPTIAATKVPPPLARDTSRLRGLNTPSFRSGPCLQLTDTQTHHGQASQSGWARSAASYPGRAEPEAPSLLSRFYLSHPSRHSWNIHCAACHQLLPVAALPLHATPPRVPGVGLGQTTYLLQISARPPSSYLGDSTSRSPSGISMLGADPSSGERTAAMCNRTGRREPAAEALSVLWSRCVIGHPGGGKGITRTPGKGVAQRAGNGDGDPRQAKREPIGRLSSPHPWGTASDRGGWSKQRPLTCWSDCLSAGIIAMQPIGRGGAFSPAPYWPARSSTARIPRLCGCAVRGPGSHAHACSHADTRRHTQTHPHSHAPAHTHGRGQGLRFQPDQGPSQGWIPHPGCREPARLPSTLGQTGCRGQHESASVGQVAPAQRAASGRRSARRTRNACHWTAFAGRPPLPDAREPLGGCARDFLRITFNY